MALFRTLREDGISLKSTHGAMMAITILLAGVLLFETFLTSYYSKQLTDATDAYIALESNANQLMTASDYLTEEVQTFTVTGDRIHMDRYFEEADVTRRRDKAIEQMEAAVGETRALRRLKLAMANSVELMNKEYYAMALMIRVKGIQDYPAILDDIEISAEDAALSEDEMIRRAQFLVHDKDYYSYKTAIHSEVQNCLKALETDTHDAQNNADGLLKGRLRFMRLLVFAQMVATVVILWLTSVLGISPLLTSVEKIKQDSKIPIIGSCEFRFLAKTYNKLYEAFKSSITRLNQDTTRDKLTGLYNQAGYEALRDSIDIGSTAILLIDADDFKDINDCYGTETGDSVLIKIADTLRCSFRTEDYICRIGGDEFAVFMLHVTPKLRKLIEGKVRFINETLLNTDDGLPEIAVSVGIAFGVCAEDSNVLVQQAETALKRIKEGGGCGCSFFEEPKPAETAAEDAHDEE